MTTKLSTMKKLLICAFTFGLSLLSANADSPKTGWVYLNNGNIIKGELSHTETTVSIITPDGTQLTYPKVEVNRISYQAPTLPEVKNDPDLADMADYTKGFWFRTRLTGSCSLFLTEKCTPLIDLDVAGGYRFSQYVKAGIGFGGRYYFNNSDLRHSSIKWSFPVFATITGNIIPDTYRNVVPYYSFDIGGTIRDGFLMRPTFGIRVGQSRSAFLLGLTYTGQSLRYKTDKTRFVSSLGLSAGYEF